MGADVVDVIIASGGRFGYYENSNICWGFVRVETLEPPTPNVVSMKCPFSFNSKL